MNWPRTANGPSKKQSRNSFHPSGFVTSEEEYVWQRYMREHAVLRYVERTGETRALKISDFESVSMFHRHELYDELYRPLGIEDVICIGVPTQAPRVNGVALHRGKRDFAERDRLVLDLVRPHLAQAWRNGKIVTQMQEESRLLKQAMESLDRGVVLLSDAGNVRFMTFRASQWLNEFFADARRPSNRLPEGVRRWMRHQESLPGEANIAAPRTPLVAEREGKRLLMRLLSGVSQKLLPLEKQVTTLEPARFQSFGVTKREAEVLAWVALGKTNRDIATILSTSPRTVQKQLEHIFDKLGVETRTAAARVFHEASLSQAEAHPFGLTV